MTSTQTNYPWQRYPNNILIVKDDVGKSKSATFAIPDIAFGKTLKLKEEGVKEVLMPLQHVPSQEPRPQRSFIALNKMSAQANLYTAKDVAIFRNYNNATVHIPKGHQRSKEQPQQQCFGRANKPSSPIRDVLGNYFGAEAELKQQQAYSRPSSSRTNRSKVSDTKSSRLLQEAMRLKTGELCQSRPLSKMSQFRNVEAKVKSRY